MRTSKSPPGFDSHETTVVMKSTKTELHLSLFCDCGFCNLIKVMSRVGCMKSVFLHLSPLELRLLQITDSLKIDL